LYIDTHVSVLLSFHNVRINVLHNNLWQMAMRLKCKYSIKTKD